jgi:hypothetical protein
MSISPTESIRFAGDINIRRLEIISSENYKVDITNQLIGMEIYEDMFSPFLTMAITIRESQDFINALPLRGEEILKMEISTPTFEKESMFFKDRYYIYKISDRQLLTDRNTVYTLYCISYEALVDLNMKQSKAYRGNISDIVRELMSKEGLDSTKKYNIESTKNSIKYISNFWSPVKNLNFLSTHAINNDGNASYLFYESRGVFNFTSLDTLYKQDVYQKFIKDNYSRDTEGNTSYINLDREYSRILDFKVRVSFDALKFTNSGAYASRLYSYDLVKKKYTAKDYNALDEYSNSSHLNKNPLYSNSKPVSSRNFIMNEVKHYGNHDGFTDTSNTKIVQQRNSKLNLIRSCVIEINVFGRTDYTIGQKVYVEVPKPTIIIAEDQADTKNGFIDKAYSGNYIITAINHVISREKHMCVMELSKESIME